MSRRCDLCGMELLSYFIDAKMKAGPWATMCESCHKSVGVGFGLGRGQRFDMKGNKQEG